MICYQDEKIYGPYNNGKTIEQLEKEIAELEMKIYGHRLPEPDPNKKRKKMIYDTEQNKLVEVPDWYLKELEERYRREDEEELARMEQNKNSQK